MTDMTFFEVETTYKSGKRRVEVVTSANEETFWKWYNVHHNMTLVVDSVIIDAWCA